MLERLSLSSKPRTLASVLEALGAQRVLTGKQHDQFGVQEIEFFHFSEFAFNHL